jgi:hypothetical protein
MEVVAVRPQLGGCEAPLPEDHFAMIPTGSSTHSKIEASSFSGLFTLVEIGHMVIGSEGKGTTRSQGSGSRGDSQRS